MNLSILAVAVLLSSCGVESSKVNSLTDNKTILVYQQSADGYRLLSCPYAIDLQIDDRCINVFSTVDGAGEYLFSDTPQKPRLFAPSQDSVRKLTYLPIVVGSALLTYLVVKKIRFRQAQKAVPEYRQLKAVADASERFKTFDDRFRTSVKDYLEQGQQWRPRRWQGKGSGGTSLADLIDKQPLTDDGRSAADRLTDIHREIAKLDTAIKESIDDFDANQQLVIKKGFSDLHQVYGKNGKVAQTFESLRNEDTKYLNDKQVDDFVKVFNQDIRQTDEVLSYFWELLADTGSAGKARDRATASLVKDSNGDKRIFADYLIAGVSGLLAGSYLPKLLPSLDSRLLTATEWQALFDADKVYTVKDNRRVIKKLASHLQSRGQPVIINNSLTKNW